MRNDGDDYFEIYRVDADDEWRNGAYDESGNVAVCDICGAEMRWDQGLCEWYCPECGQLMNRSQYFNHIGAEPPGRKCLTNCCENYPFCKKYCDRYKIDPNDPMLT
jgi:predicted RNA-binding Zn-ribbon protein involved in translation (DUF1610 family)